MRRHTAHLLTAHLLFALVAVGLLARAVRYLLRFPLWSDEVALAANLLDRGWLELLKPLDFDQVAPLGFLWAELASVRVFGFSEYSLRIPALLCGLASVPLFIRLASQMLKPASLVLAVGIFAVSYPCIRYAAESKHYGCDLLASLLLLWLLAEWLATSRPKWLWLMALAMPVSMLFSFTAVFIAGGVIVTAALQMVLHADGDGQDRGVAANSDVVAAGKIRRFWPSWRLSRSAQSRHGWLALAGVAVSLLLSGAAVYWLTIRPQSQAHLSGMQACWEQAFPPLAEPLRLPMWLLDTFTGQMLAYPVGGHCFGSTLTFLLCATAVVVWWRRRRWVALTACLSPMVFTLLAAALRRYPCGDMVRFQLYMAPIFSLLAGEGLAMWLTRLWGKKQPQSCPHAALAVSGHIRLFVACAVLMGIGLASVVRDVAHPYKGDIDRQYRCLVQRLWAGNDRAQQTLCLWSDLQVTFSPGSWRTRAAAMYLCNQRIYRPRLCDTQVFAPGPAMQGEVGQSPPYTQPAPACLVEFYCAHHPYDTQGHAAWLQQMEEHYRLVRMCFFALGDATNSRGVYRAEAMVTVYCFQPRGQQ